MTFNVFMPIEKLCSLLMCYYTENVKTEDRYHGNAGGGYHGNEGAAGGGLDLKATEQKKIR